MKIRKLRSPYLILLLSLTACTGMGPQKNQYNYAEHVSISDHKHATSLAITNKDYKEALKHLYILNALEPQNPIHVNRIRIVKAIASRQADMIFNKGVSALRKGNTEDAKRLFLKTLNQQPNHELAIKQLQQMNTNEVMRVQLANLKKLKRRNISMAESE